MPGGRCQRLHLQAGQHRPASFPDACLASPLKMAHPDLRSTTEPPPPVAEDALPINILIVDDEPANLLVLETVLDDPGYRLVRALSAEQALRALMADEFAVLVLDIQLPDMNGIELAQMIKERKKTAHLPIIFLTAYFDQDQHRLQGYGSGAVDYLSKPVNAVVLRSKVAVFAELHRKTREVQRANTALLAEVEERRRAEEQLRELNETLEQRVRERSEALLQADRKLQATLNSITDGLLLIEHDGRIGYANEQGALLLGCHAAELLGQHRRDVFSGAAFELGFQRALAGRQAVSFESQVEGDRWLQCHCYPSDDGLSVYFHDVTDRRELQLRREQLLAAEQAARSASEHASHAKEQFIAAVSHELRTPLAAIVGWANVLVQPGIDAATVHRGIQAIARNAQAQSVLVADLLEMSRLIAGKLRMDMQPLDLNDIVTNAADTARPTAESRQLGIELQMSPQPAGISGDPSRLMQIVMNLLTNAMKFTPAGGCVTVATTVHADSVELSVSDTGQGIEAGFIPRLFDRFSQADDLAARVHGGLGLGLSIVKNLTELHGGEVSASSPGPDRGSVFVVRLPRASSGRSPLEGVPGAETEEASVAGLNVLLVDDHADVLEAHARMLSEQGAHVTTAQSAVEALGMLAERNFNILLSDLGMPGMDGYALARRVRGELGLSAETLPAVAVTAFVRTEDRDAALDAGYQACLQKPVSPLQFVRTVARYALRPRVQAPLRALFVEDNDDLREQIMWMLEEEGLQVRAFASAEEALQAYRPDEVDLVITDVSLIGMSGVDLARAILRIAPDAWVVFSSGYAMGNALKDFGPHVRALLKPFDFADIRRLIDEISAGRAAK
ncbi:MAG: response regulator [Rubrivivax sp.]|nr:MAG: response regulator [Rubrivivax sp.]